MNPLFAAALGLQQGSAEAGEAPDLWSEEAPVLAAVAAASVEGRVALGPRIALLRLPDENRLRTAALSALSKGEGLSRDRERA